MDKRPTIARSVALLTASPDTDAGRTDIDMGALRNLVDAIDVLGVRRTMERHQGLLGETDGVASVFRRMTERESPLDLSGLVRPAAPRALPARQ